MRSVIFHREYVLIAALSEMAPFYRLVTSTKALPLDQALMDELEQANRDELQRLDAKLEDAKTQEGESDIADALKARANHLTRVGDKVCFGSYRCEIHLRAMTQ